MLSAWVSLLPFKTEIAVKSACKAWVMSALTKPMQSLLVWPQALLLATAHLSWSQDSHPAKTHTAWPCVSILATDHLTWPQASLLAMGCLACHLHSSQLQLAGHALQRNTSSWHFFFFPGLWQLSSPNKSPQFQLLTGPWLYVSLEFLSFVCC